MVHLSKTVCGIFHFRFHLVFIKGYLFCRTITSQNVSSEAQVKDFYVSWKSYVPLLRYSSFCLFNNPIIYQICDVMMSTSTWDRVHLWIYLLNHNSLSHQSWSTDRYKQGQYFSEIFWTIWRTGVEFQAQFNLATCSSYSITNYVKFPVFHFLKGWIREN